MQSDLQDFWRGMKKRKYRNIPTVIDGVRFDSKRESKRWCQLLLLESYGKIRKLQRQVAFPIIVNGEKICVYKADFVYEENGKRITEDSKGYRTPEYKLKKKLLKVIYNIDIFET